MELKKLKKLQKYFASYKYKCKENCYECCTAINFLQEEKILMDKELKKNGFSQAPNGKGNNYCEYLTTEGKCSIYNQRPMICRAFSDIKYLYVLGNKKAITPSCIHGSQKKIKLSSKEFIKYGMECNNLGITNKNALNIVNNLKNNLEI